MSGQRRKQKTAILLLASMMVLGGCQGDSSGKTGGRQPSAPVVVVGVVEKVAQVSRIEAVGTARANEQAELNSTVTERLARINYNDGQFVRQGAVIAELVRGEQGASLSQSQARLREAEQQLERLQQLQQQGFATRARVDEQLAAVEVARAQGAAASSQIGDRIIKAPFSGYLSLRHISVGQVVSAGTTIATIVDHSRIKLDFRVPEIVLTSIKPGLKIEASAAAYPGELFRGKVQTIDPIVDVATRTILVRAIIPNPDLRLRPGMLMTVEIKSAPQDTLIVPELAVIREGGKAFVWLVDGDDNVSRTEVTTGTRRDGSVQILSGLNEGDRIVVDGTVKIRAAGPIKPVTPEEARELAKESAA